MKDLHDEIEHGMRGYILMMLDLHYKRSMRLRKPHHDREFDLKQFFRPEGHVYPCRRITTSEAAR